MTDLEAWATRLRVHAYSMFTYGKRRSSLDFLKISQASAMFLRLITEGTLWCFTTSDISFYFLVEFYLYSIRLIGLT